MNEFLAHFHFARPLWLLLIVPALLLFFACLRNSRQTSEWKSIIDAHLLPFLLDGKTVTASKVPLYGLLSVWITASVALAGPVWKQLPQPLHQDTSALVILWDLSPSMNAADVKPSRLIRSRLKLIDLLNERREGLTGLVVYGGEAHVVTPLTDDNQTIVNLLSSLSPEILPLKGSNPEMAMEKAIELLKDAGVAKGDILFLTDGIAPSALHTLETLQEKSGHQVTVWGIGTSEGAPIPGMHGGFARDDSGDIVVAKLDEPFLSEVASELGGLYVPFANTDRDIRTIMDFSLAPTAELSRETTRLFDEWYEHGPWLLLALLPLAALAFRRGWLLSIAFVVLIPQQKAEALSWSDLWQTKDQQAAEKLESGDAASAAQTFADPRWKAIANYKADNYEEAAKLFQQVEDSAASWYNRGNALTHLQDYDKALEAYDKALKMDPNLEQARKNRGIAEKLKQLQEQQQQANNDQQQGDQSQQQQSQQQQSQQQSQQQNGQQDQAGEQNEQQQSEQSNQSQSSSSQQNENQQAQQQQSQQDSSLSEEQKAALDRKYQSSESEEESNEANQSTEPQSVEQEEISEQEPRQQQAREPSEQDPTDEQSEQQARASIAQIEQRENSEEQQALEQWLRKVPDDPSGLLRNKFKYEYNQRRREFQSGDWRPPENDANRRW